MGVLKHTVKIDLRDYRIYYGDVDGWRVDSKRAVRRMLRERFLVSVHHVRGTGRFVVYLTPEDAISLKLKL